MKRLRTLFRSYGLDALIAGSVSATLGIGIGVIVAGSHEWVNSLTDPTPYQNFSVLTGALTGLISVCLVTALYGLTTKYILRHTWFHQRLFLVSSSIAGTLTGLVTYIIVSLSARDYGMITHTGVFVYIDGVICAALGGGAGVFTGAMLSLIRGYESR